MTATLSGQDAEFTRRFRYELVGKPRLTNTNYEDITPTKLMIELTRKTEQKPWWIKWIIVSGPRFRADGSRGLRNEEHLFDASDGTCVDPQAPDWLPPLVAQTYQLAESERLQRKDGDSVTLSTATMIDLLHDAHWAGVHETNAGHDAAASYRAKIDAALERLGITWARA